jgi:hypothetical protein
MVGMTTLPTTPFGGTLRAADDPAKGAGAQPVENAGVRHHRVMTGLLEKALRRVESLSPEEQGAIRGKKKRAPVGSRALSLLRR